MLGPSVHRGRVLVLTTIGLDGRVTVGPVEPRDFARVRAKVMTVMRVIGRGNPIGISECLSPEQKSEMAQRLADMFAREVET